SARATKKRGRLPVETGGVSCGASRSGFEKRKGKVDAPSWSSVEICPASKLPLAPAPSALPSTAGGSIGAGAGSFAQAANARTRTGERRTGAVYARVAHTRDFG